ncbi:hypothetical protein BH10PSE7_BH10PSE7_29520 [soil metagenome]
MRAFSIGLLCGVLFVPGFALAQEEEPPVQDEPPITEELPPQDEPGTPDPPQMQPSSLRLNNLSGKGVTGLYLSPKGSEVLSDSNLLSNAAALDAEQSVEIPIVPTEGQCVFDLRLQFADTSEVVRNDIDLCQPAELNIE